MVRSREYLDKLWDAKDWLDSNCLYLDVQSVKAIDECIAHLMGEHIFPDDPKRLDLEFMKKYDELKSDALRKLSEGVGVPWSKSKIKKEHEKLREK